jgi:hypothetical protein
MLPRDEVGATLARKRRSGASKFKSTLDRVSFIVTGDATVRLSSCFNRDLVSSFGTGRSISDA